METLVQFTQSGPSLCSLPQMGLNYSKARDGICWRSNMAGGDIVGSSCTAFSSSPLAPCSSVMRPSLVVKSSQRMQIDVDGKRGEVFTNVDVRLIRHRMSRGRDQIERRAASRRIKVRSFVDEATAHSVEVESSSPSAISERDGGEAGGADLDSDDEFREPDDQLMADGEPTARDNNDGEYGLGIKSIEEERTPSGDPDYNYDDMKFGEEKNWSIEEMKKIDLLKNFEYRQESENGVFVVQAMRVEHLKVTEELLVDSFAELMGGLLTYRPLLALTVRQHLRERYACLPDAVTLVGLYAPAKDNAEKGRAENDCSSNWLLVGTVELLFSNVGHSDIPAGPAPPMGSPYLCNMAISRTYRRRGLGRQLLKAAEELVVLMGAEDMYLHCRMVDLAPFNMYQMAGYQIIATDSILSLLSLQRRRYLMHKRLLAPIPASAIS